MITEYQHRSIKRRAQQDDEYELIEDNLKSVGDQSPARESDGDFL
jgi:hypothetical protein